MCRTVSTEDAIGALSIHFVNNIGLLAYKIQLENQELKPNDFQVRGTLGAEGMLQSMRNTVSQD